MFSKNTNKADVAPAMKFIFITILIDSLGFGIFIPIFPRLLGEISHSSISDASVYAGWLNFTYAFMQFISSPVLGALSDRYGRRPVLIISLGALGINYIALGLSQSLLWLFLARTVSGIMGASYTTATAYAADISTDKNRSKNFGIIGAAFGMGFVIGPVLGGLLGQFGSRVPLFFAAGLTLVNVAYGLIAIPESMKEFDKSRIKFKNINPIGMLIHFSNNKKIMKLVLVFSLLMLAFTVIPNIWSFYLIEKFNGSPQEIGYSLGFFGGSLVVMQGVVNSAMHKWLGENKVMIYGLILASICFVCFAFAPQLWLMFLIAPFFHLGWLCTVSVRSLLSKEVPSIEQGKLQGLTNSAFGIANVLGPVIMTSTFYFFTSLDSSLIFPGAPFILSFALTIISLLMVVGMINKDKKLAS